jgi:hypothetical protein
MDENILKIPVGGNKGKFSKDHTVRTRSGGRIDLKLSPRQAIKAFCTECMGWEVNPVDCAAELCPLFPFRGKTLSTNDIGDVAEKGA